MYLMSSLGSLRVSKIQCEPYCTEMYCLYINVTSMFHMWAADLSWVTLTGWYGSTDGSVVEFSPATREARVRFPVSAVFLSIWAHVYSCFGCWVPCCVYFVVFVLASPAGQVIVCSDQKLFVWWLWWFSGRILACHAGGPGSIPGQCIVFCSPIVLEIWWLCLHVRVFVMCPKGMLCLVCVCMFVKFWFLKCL